MYSGSAGIVHEFDAILEAMRWLDDDPRTRVLGCRGANEI